MTITSLDNKNIKELVKLRERKGRRKSGDFLIEGRREIERAIIHGFGVEAMYVCGDLLREKPPEIGGEVFPVSLAVYKKIAMRETSEGVIGVAKMRTYTLEQMSPGDSPPLWMACEGVEKPGNIGALLRSIDGAGGHGLFLLGDGPDVYNPLTIRASLGTVFSTPHVHIHSESFLQEMKNRDVQVVAAALSQESTKPWAVDFQRPTVICLGTEADGLSQTVLRGADAVVEIPMLGTADSLNVSAAGAILLYESVRQRSGG